MSDPSNRVPPMLKSRFVSLSKEPHGGGEGGGCMLPDEKYQRFSEFTDRCFGPNLVKHEMAIFFLD